MKIISGRGLYFLGAYSEGGNRGETLHTYWEQPKSRTCTHIERCSSFPMMFNKDDLASLVSQTSSHRISENCEFYFDLLRKYTKILHLDKN